jgi:hypothetical protein
MISVPKSCNSPSKRTTCQDITSVYPEMVQIEVGENVMPLETKLVHSLHPDVVEAIVIGRSDDSLCRKITTPTVSERDISTRSVDAHFGTSRIPAHYYP